MRFQNGECEQSEQCTRKYEILKFCQSSKICILNVDVLIIVEKVKHQEVNRKMLNYHLELEKVIMRSVLQCKRFQNGRQTGESARGQRFLLFISVLIIVNMKI